MDRSPLSGLRVLVVEDEPLILMDVRDALEEAGAVTVAACTIAHAHAAVASGRLSAAVLDFAIGREDCTSVAASLAGAGVPYLFTTGLDSDDRRLRSTPQAPIITKPFSHHQIVAGLIRLVTGCTVADGAAHGMAGRFPTPPAVPLLRLRRTMR